MRLRQGGAARAERWWWVVALAVLASAGGAQAATVYIPPNAEVGYGTDIRDTTPLEDIEFSGSTPSAVTNAVTRLTAALAAHRQAPTSATSTAVRTAETALDDAVAAARGDTLGSLVFDQSYDKIATADADQRFSFHSSAGNLHIEDGQRLAIVGNVQSSDSGGGALIFTGGFLAQSGGGQLVFSNNTAMFGGGIYTAGTLRLTNALFSGNKSTTDGGTLCERRRGRRYQQCRVFRKYSRVLWRSN